MYICCYAHLGSPFLYFYMYKYNLFWVQLVLNKLCKIKWLLIPFTVLFGTHACLGFSLFLPSIYMDFVVLSQSVLLLVGVSMNVE